MHDTTFLRRRACQLMCPSPPIMVPVHGDITELREVTERSYYRRRRILGESAEDDFQLRARLLIARTAEMNRCLANALNEIEDSVAFLLAQRVAEQTAE